MKKLSLGIVLLFTVISMSGCFLTDYYFLDYDEMTREVVSVQLVYCTNDNPEVIDDPTSEQVHFDYEKALVVKTLDESLLDEFLQDLSKVEFFLPAYESVNSPVGFAIVLKKKDNSMTVISSTYTDEKIYQMAAEIAPDGSMSKNLASFSTKTESMYRKLLNKYFNISL